MEPPYTPPSLNLTAFNCPHCHALAKQSWHPVLVPQERGGMYHLKPFSFAICFNCQSPSIWNGSQMIFPNLITAPHPNQDLTDDIKADFEEARQIANSSPRGAAALLRLAIQKICVHLGEKGKDLNKDIGKLVDKGLSPKIQKALDIVRVVGNESVHPGQIDLNDKPETATKLFNLINIIAETMISQPKEIEALYDDIIPEGKKEAIAKRDEE